MAGCGYVCPLCEGRGMDEHGNDCDHCTVPKNKSLTEEQEEWVRKVHEGPCCSHPEEEE
ncbi:MAG: hypothetical protein J7604_03355 [Sporocytophaga sp.]|uniref:hypothetical protein n=1 Tax=Sporocytophaga sp. TaxID=2231183 RepID=UPI001B270F77|nr:hypothetical protein [Sporocytophaga sp.]MBO9699218.1 hypothetical protein [Sporocytophaga sp.]